MSWWDIFTGWPKRLPEGEVKTVNVAGITVFLCGKNHPVLDKAKQARGGGVIEHNNFMWLKGYRCKTGEFTIDRDIAGWEFQRLMHFADKEIVSPDEE